MTLQEENDSLKNALALADALINKGRTKTKMLTTTQANKLRGLINYTIECAVEDAFAGAQDAHAAMHVREEYRLAKDRMLSEIRELTEPKAAQ